MKLGRWIVAGLLTLLTVLAGSATAAERIPLYTYYVDPPFAANGEDGFTDELAAWLTQQSAGRYVFIPTQIPRRRLDILISGPHWKGVVAWANPLWFGKNAEAQQDWSRPYMLDANLVISLRNAPVNFTGDPSLAGRKLGTVLGYTYPDLDVALRAGMFTKEDSLGEFNNLMKLKRGRVDVAFLQASSFPYFRRKFPDFEAWSFVAPKPRTVFTRRLFMSPGQPALMHFLDEQIAVLARDKTWRQRFGTCDLFATQAPNLRASTEGLCK